jgi:hypothetical protein
MNLQFSLPGLGWQNYLLVLFIYLLLFVVIRNANNRIELNFQRSALVLAIGWSISVFAGNYLFYRIGIMSFLPWFNNFIHSFIWIGYCLSFMYAGCYKKPLLQQCLLFSIFSFFVKHTEHELLGTWEHDNFFGIPGNTSYIIGWSLMDGLYPVISRWGLRQFSKIIDGIVVPG